MTPEQRTARGRISGASFVPVDDSHPVEWLRGKVIVEVAVDMADVTGLRIGGDVVLGLLPESGS